MSPNSNMASIYTVRCERERGNISQSSGSPLPLRTRLHSAFPPCSACRSPWRSSVWRRSPLPSRCSAGSWTQTWEVWPSSPSGGTRWWRILKYFIKLLPLHLHYLWLTHQCSKYKNNADNDEGLNGCETISFRNLVGDAVEDVDQAEEDGDEDGHSARDTLRGNEEADPANNDKHSSREVVGDDVVRHLAPQRHLETRHRIVAWKCGYIWHCRNVA